MRRIVLAWFVLLALSVVATAAQAAPRNYSASNPYRPGYWQKGYGWAGYGWYSPYGDFTGYGYSSIGVRYRGNYVGNPAYLTPRYPGSGNDLGTGVGR
ncbi:MAG: hypothetical protein JSS27_03790 [Planctomycetes bacterium]|nr:hypothetical protein [Planctomycetota bacterium]